METPIVYFARPSYLATIIALQKVPTAQPCMQVPAPLLPDSPGYNRDEQPDSIGTVDVIAGYFAVSTLKTVATAIAWLDNKLSKMDTKFNKIDTNFDIQGSRLNKMPSAMQTVLMSIVVRVAVLVLGGIPTTWCDTTSVVNGTL